MNKKEIKAFNEAEQKVIDKYKVPYYNDMGFEIGTHIHTRYKLCNKENCEYIRELQEINEQHRKTNGELRQIIKEAIEYIHKRTIDGKYEFDNNNIIDLLQILDGSCNLYLSMI